MIRERIDKLRKSMKAAEIDCYLIPTSDYHDSEYVSGFFAVRKYFSGFTGSAGTLVVTEKEAALFTDARYFIQAAKQLEGTGIVLMKMGEPKVPTIAEYLEQTLLEGQTLGFDGRVVKAGDAKEYEEILKKKNGRLIWDKDLSEGIWEDRPAIVHQPMFLLEERYSGESAAAKIKRVREKMQEEEATVHILTSLDDIAWLLNLRGDDMKNFPIVIAYAVITMEKVLLFAKGLEGESAQEGKNTQEGKIVQEEESPQEGKTVQKEESPREGKTIQKEENAQEEKGTVWTPEILEYLEKNGVELLFYNDFYKYVSELHGQKVLLCRDRVNSRVERGLAEDMTIIDKPNPTSLMKAVKNPVEMENLRKAHIKDGVAVARFMYWLKKNIGKIPMTEWSATEYIDGMRQKNENFIETSFGTICAYGPNGAINHYSASPEDCLELRPEGLLVVDSGGHYLEGSTDITRTFALGPVTKEMKEHYTLVLRSMLNMRATKFLYGCRGSNLDIRAREVLWEKGLDYKHGTGHGVGYILNVHEGPNNFRWKPLPGQESAVLEEGMVTTDEPGIYIEGSHGIRIENELLCRKGEENEYGQFMYFEDLTFAPIDLDAVEVSSLSDLDKERLNTYHREVYEKLSPYFEGEELAWLSEATRAI
ncbi:MAG: aminopeptidase P family protein [Clostridium sp.]|nr:aminopeptidase P family protein [Clostridium sp.]